MLKLCQEFYEKYDTITLAQKLIGCELVHESEQGTTSGIIVETEAYLQNDPASHAFNGKTKRNEAMFGQAGTAYIYLIYGMYECFNVVSYIERVGEAVLIRALQPVSGIELMQERRNQKSIKNLCRGPGKLVQAMGISRRQNGVFLDEKLHIISSQMTDNQLVTTTRIGITKAADLPYRFYLKDSLFVSLK
jgi:DNA-3-methyladenine glycosylase